MKTKQIRRKICDPIINIAIHILTTIMWMLPFKATRIIAKTITQIIYPFQKKNKKLIQTNLKIAFPNWTEKQYTQTTKQTLNNSILLFLEFLWFLKHPKQIQKYIKLPKELTNYLNKYKTAKQTLIMLTPHLGNWEILGQAVASYGYSIHAVARPIRNKCLNNLILKARNKHGMKIIDQKGAAKTLFRLIKQGENIAMLIDQNTRLHQGGIFAPFFGLPVTSSRAPATFIRRQNLSLYTASCVRTKKGFKVIFRILENPNKKFPTDQEITTELLKHNQSLIQEYPQQYAWVYKRWRYIPKETTPEQKQKYPYYAIEQKY